MHLEAYNLYSCDISGSGRVVTPIIPVSEKDLLIDIIQSPDIMQDIRRQPLKLTYVKQTHQKPHIIDIIAQWIHI